MFRLVLNALAKDLSYVLESALSVTERLRTQQDGNHSRKQIRPKQLMAVALNMSVCFREGEMESSHLLNLTKAYC